MNNLNFEQEYDYDIRPSPSPPHHYNVKNDILDMENTYNLIKEYDYYKKEKKYAVFGKIVLIVLILLIILFLVIKLINLIFRKRCSYNDTINKGLDYKKSNKMMCKIQKTIDPIANVEKIVFSKMLTTKDGHKKYFYDSEIGQLIYNKDNGDKAPVNVGEVIISEINKN